MRAPETQPTGFLPSQTLFPTLGAASHPNTITITYRML
jgi:hypothetical protein